MKNFTTLLFLFISISYINAQCLQVAGDFGNNLNVPMYNIEGDVTITLNTDNTITLDLGANFMTAAGPDIRAFLVNPGILTDAQLVNTPIGSLENFQFGLVGSDTVNQNGAKSFTVPVPNGIDISQYNKIFFYCLQFDQFWDFGTFEAFSDTNCGILSVEDQLLESITFSPNPAQEIITINNPQLAPVSISIFNTLGQKSVALRDVQNTSQTLDISSLSSGLYIIEMTLGAQRTMQKLIKQ